jgi:hypothetical protein
MTTAFLPIGDHIVAFGLEWQPVVAAVRPGKAVRDRAKASKAKLVALATPAQGTQTLPTAGLVTLKKGEKIPSPKKGGKLISAAVAFIGTLGEKDRRNPYVYLAVLPDDRVAAVCIRDSVPELDVVGDGEEVFARVASWVGSDTGTTINYGIGFPSVDGRVHPDFSLESDILASHFPSEALASITFDPVMEVVPVGRIDTLFAVHQGVKQTASSGQYVVLAIALSVIGAGGYFAWPVIFPPPPPKQIDPAVAYRKSVNDLLATRSKAPAAALVSHLYRNVNQIPLVRGGWALTKVECVPTECKLFWRRGSGDFVQLSKSSSGDPAQLAFTMDKLNEAVETVPIGELSGFKPLDPAVAPKFAESTKALGTLFQMFADAGVSSVSVKDPTPLGTPNGLPKTHPSIVMGGDWAMQGDIAFVDALGMLPEQFGLNKITFSISSFGASFDAAGYYYSK